jgi:hypothetical protein
MLDHDSALDPVTIRFVDVEQPDPVLRRWTIFPLVKNYVSCAVSAVLPIETNCRLKVQWDGANELVSRDFYGQDVSWLEITRLGSVWFKSSKVSMLIE